MRALATALNILADEITCDWQNADGKRYARSEIVAIMKDLGTAGGREDLVAFGFIRPIWHARRKMMGHWSI